MCAGHCKGHSFNLFPPYPSFWVRRKTVKLREYLVSVTGDKTRIESRSA